MTTIQKYHRTSTMPEDHNLFQQACTTARIKPVPISEFFSCGCCTKKNKFCEFVRSKTCYFILALVGLLSLLALLSLLRRARSGSCFDPEIKEDKLEEKGPSVSDTIESYKIPLENKDNGKEQCKEQNVMDEMPCPVVCKSHKIHETSNFVKRRVKCKTPHKQKECKSELCNYDQLCKILCEDQKDSDEYLFKEGNINPLNPLEKNFFILSEDLKKYLGDIEFKADNINVKCSSGEILSSENLSNSCLEQDSRTLLKDNICNIEKGLRNLTAKVDTLVKCGDGNKPTTDHVKDNNSKTKLELKIEYLEEIIKHMEDKLKSVEEQTKPDKINMKKETDDDNLFELNKQPLEQLNDKHGSIPEPTNELRTDESLKQELEETIENIGKELLEINEKSKSQQSPDHNREKGENSMMTKKQVEELFRDLRILLEKYFPDKSMSTIRTPDVKDGFDIEIYKENVEKIAKLSEQLETCLKEKQNRQTQLDKDKTNGRSSIKQNETNEFNKNIEHNILYENSSNQTSESLEKNLVQNVQKTEKSIEDPKKDERIDTEEILEDKKIDTDNNDTNSLNQILDREINEHFEKSINGTNITNNHIIIKKESDHENGQNLEKDSFKNDLNLPNNIKNNFFEKQEDTKNDENTDKSDVKTEETKTEVRSNDLLKEELDRELMENLEKETIENRSDDLKEVLNRKLMENLEKETKIEDRSNDLKEKLIDNLEEDAFDDPKVQTVDLDKDLQTDMMDNLDQFLAKEENSGTLEKQMETKLMENLERNATENGNQKSQQEPSATFIQELQEDLNNFINKHFEADANEGIEGQHDQSNISFTSMDQLQLDLIDDIQARLGFEIEESKTETPTERKKTWLRRKMPKMPKFGNIFPKGPKSKEFMEYPR